jgi:hypothetical protein
MSDSLFPIDLANPGRMISASRSGYMSQHPKNLVMFNGGIYTKSKGHVWSGDLDVTLDEARLKEIAIELGETIYLFRESTYRPDLKLEDIPFDQAITRFRPHDGKAWDAPGHEAP